MVGVLVAALAARTYRRARHRPSGWALHAIPSALLVAVACVAISRVVRFQPGYLYGLIGGAAFLVALDEREEGRSEAVVMTAVLLFAFVAWFVFGALVPQANGRDPSFGVLVADSLLAGLFIAGLEGLFFSLIPLRFLPGYRVKAWSWWAWVGLTAVVSFAFVSVLLRPASGYLGRPTQMSVTLTFVLFAAFGAASVLFWVYFRLRPGPREVAEPPALELQEAGR
jgi:hypothetical protein